MQSLIKKEKKKKTSGPQVCVPLHLFSLGHSPAMTAFVDATAGIILLTTPATFTQVTKNKCLMLPSKIRQSKK